MPDHPPTARQLKWIRDLERRVPGLRFTGKTDKEAYDWISEHRFDLPEPDEIDEDMAQLHHWGWRD